MKAKMFFALFLILSLLMSGCSAVDGFLAPATITATVEQAVQATYIPLPTQTLYPTYTPWPTYTPYPTVMPTATMESQVQPATPSVVLGLADVREVIETFDSGSWKVTLYQGATNQMRDWMRKLKNPDPRNWPNFPNVDNPQVQFEAKNGLEYGLDERNYCPQETCDVIVAAGEYTAISADYDFGFVSCGTKDGQGCLIALFNVGEVSANFEQVTVDNGFSAAGRYWNGDELQQAMWGLVSHMSANMLNLPTSLNPAESSNAGANCSVKTGCESVLARIVVLSGNQVLVVAETTITE